MPTVSLIALKPHRYDGRLVRKGQPFLAQSADDATVLRVMGVATDAPVIAAIPTPPAAPLVIEMGSPQGDDPADDTPGAILAEAADWAQPRKRRTYRRKDLVAED